MACNFPHKLRQNVQNEANQLTVILCLFESLHVVSCDFVFIDSDHQLLCQCHVWEFHLGWTTHLLLDALQWFKWIFHPCLCGFIALAECQCTCLELVILTHLLPLISRRHNATENCSKQTMTPTVIPQNTNTAHGSRTLSKFLPKLMPKVSNSWGQIQTCLQ